MIKRVWIFLALGLLIGCKTTQVQKTTAPKHISLDRQQYINEYSDLAVKEMKRSGIPASVTLAQALLESNNGNSTLATKGKNHFGIKCHSTWKGKRIYHDDDRKGECFRKYPSVYDSYVDHTNFLVNTRRYSFLFDLDQNDYKGWSRGLQKAGYATSRTYATNLIRIIEDNQLYVYDRGGTLSFNTRKDTVKEQSEEHNSSSGNNTIGDVDNFTIDINKHTIRNRNRVDYIIVKGGDTFKRLTAELEMLDWELPKYNELKENHKLTEGMVLYLQPKRNKAEVGNDYHIVKEGESMYLISQMYAVKMKKLYERNHMQLGAEPKPGDKLYLRKDKPLEEINENAIELDENL